MAGPAGTSSAVAGDSMLPAAVGILVVAGSPAAAGILAVVGSSRLVVVGSLAEGTVVAAGRDHDLAVAARCRTYAVVRRRKVVGGSRAEGLRGRPDGVYVSGRREVTMRLMRFGRYSR